MTQRTVKDQQGLNAALADRAIDLIIIKSPRGIWLTIGSNGIHSATVRASGSATVRASGSATVEAWGSATVEAWGSATVEASGSATVEASGSATVEATPYVAVHLHSAYAKVSGGVIIDVAALDLTDPQIWCDYHGVTVDDGIATLYKAVGDNWSTDRGFDYSPGAKPSAPDWRSDNECGHGLHFSPRPSQSRTYYSMATRYVAVGVALADLRPISGFGAPKAKAPRVVTPCREVTIDGDPMEAAK